MYVLYVQLGSLALALKSCVAGKVQCLILLSTWCMQIVQRVASSCFVSR